MENLKELMKAEKRHQLVLGALFLDMNKIKVVKEITEGKFSKNSFIYDFLSSMRQKINDPLGVRAKKREEISQR